MQPSTHVEARQPRGQRSGLRPYTPRPTHDCRLAICRNCPALPRPIDAPSQSRGCVSTHDHSLTRINHRTCLERGAGAIRRGPSLFAVRLVLLWARHRAKTHTCGPRRRHRSIRGRGRHRSSSRLVQPCSPRLLELAVEMHCKRTPHQRGVHHESEPTPTSLS